MFVYRLCKDIHTQIDGKGGLFTQGRWHYKGTRIVYASENRSLAILENLVHINKQQFIPKDYVLLTLKIDDRLESYEINIEHELEDMRNSSSIPVTIKHAVSDAWNWSDHPEITRFIMHQLFKKEKYAIYKVPSAIVSGEYNYILNPLHKDFSSIHIYDKSQFQLDNRLK